MPRVLAIAVMGCLLFLGSATSAQADDSSRHARLGHHLDSSARPFFLVWWTERVGLGELYFHLFFSTDGSELSTRGMDTSAGDDSTGPVRTTPEGPGRRGGQNNSPGTINDDIDPQGKGSDPPVSDNARRQ